MERYYQIAGWIAGIAFILAVVLTARPSGRTLAFAVLLWIVGGIVSHAMAAYPAFTQARIAYAFDPSGGFPLRGWVLPAVRLVALLLTGALLLPKFRASSARRAALVICLIYASLLVLESYNRRIWHFPLGIGFVGLVLLWIRIRDLNDNTQKKTA